MAFGKDNSHLKNIPSYGGSMAQKAANATRARKSNAPRGGGGRPHWVDNYRPSQVKADLIRLIPSPTLVQRVENSVLTEEELPWMELTEHYHATTKQQSICSAGPFRNSKNDRDPCYGCDMYWAGYSKEIKDRGPMSTISKYAFMVLDMGQFHKVPQTDKQGNVKKDSKGNPYTNWEKCVGMGCQGCHTAIESKQGHVQPWRMSRSQFIQLNGYADAIGNCCTTCKGVDTIKTVMWQCRNPECGDLIVDIETTSATQEQVNTLVNQPYTCRACKNTDYPEEVIQCSGCTTQEPARASIFDANLQVKEIKAGSGYSIQVMSHQVAQLSPAFVELASKAGSLTDRFPPTSLEQQSKLFNYQPPLQDAQSQYIPKG